jgi:hypothetical protein
MQHSSVNTQSSQSARNFIYFFIVQGAAGAPGRVGFPVNPSFIFVMHFYLIALLMHYQLLTLLHSCYPRA